ncbi:MAG: glutathione peroxidase [Flavobacteriaceae bacterium]|nr:glutathione peroxidase [Flavobacteriaceae bacterium]
MFALFKKSRSSSLPLSPIYEIKINSLIGHKIDLADFKGKNILFVNVASKCGFTNQYKGLQELYRTYKDQLMVIGVPSNQFGSQEPGSASEIKNFCTSNYGVDFLMTEKIDVKGQSQHELYQWLTKKSLNGSIDSSVKWNFQKYFINKEGLLIDYFYSATQPLSKKITKHL